MVGRIQCNSEVMVDDGALLGRCGRTDDPAKGRQKGNENRSSKSGSHRVTLIHQRRTSTPAGSCPGLSRHFDPPTAVGATLVVAPVCAPCPPATGRPQGSPLQQPQVAFSRCS